MALHRDGWEGCLLTLKGLMSQASRAVGRCAVAGPSAFLGSLCPSSLLKVSSRASSNLPLNLWPLLPSSLLWLWPSCCPPPGRGFWRQETHQLLNVKVSMCKWVCVCGVMLYNRRLRRATQKWDTLSCNSCLLQRRITQRLWTGNTCMKMVRVMLTRHTPSTSSARAALVAGRFHSFLIGVQHTLCDLQESHVSNISCAFTRRSCPPSRKVRNSACVL